MSLSTLGLPQNVQSYLRTVGVRESDPLRRLREETASLPAANMQVASEQGALLAMLARLCGARRTLDIGVFTGYSALCIAEALPENGRVVACDVDEEWTRIARRAWEAAGLAHKIELHLRPAVQTLDALLQKGDAGSFDFAFIDADKESYGQYFDRCLELLRPGGLIAVDNVLWGGRVADPQDSDGETAAIRAFNSAVAGDQRVDIALIPIADGLTLARKR